MVEMARAHNKAVEADEDAARSKEGSWLNFKRLRETIDNDLFVDDKFIDGCMASLRRLADDGYIGTRFKLIGSGADGYLFVTQSGRKSKEAGEFVAVKVYRSERGNGDTAAVSPEKEWTILRRAWYAGVSVPRPVAHRGGVIVMQFIGYSTEPADLLYNSKIRDQQKVFAQLITDVARLRGAGIDHGDLHEANIMVKDGKPYIIDFSRATVSDKPISMPREVHYSRDLAWTGGDMRFFTYFQEHGVDTESAYKSAYRTMLRKTPQDKAAGAGGRANRK